MDYTPGEILPPPPLGPDPNSVLGALEDGGNVSIQSAAGVYAAYFSRYAPNLNKVAGLNYKQGYSSEYLPDQPGTPTDATNLLISFP